MTTSIYNISNYSIHSNKTPIESKFTLFLENSFNIHGTLFDYSRVNYINNDIEIEIICSEHGSFWQKPSVHTHGSGCKSCQSKNTSKRCRKSNTQFILDAMKVHGNKYDYSKVIYQTNDTSVKIGCPTHGFVDQTPSSHLRGRICPKCSYESYGYGWHTPRISPDADNIYYLYEIKLTSNDETFYKTGITDNLKRRHGRISKFGYDVEIIYLTIDTKYVCGRIEKKLLKKRQRLNKYIPHIKFDGWTECYS